MGASASGHATEWCETWCARLRAPAVAGTISFGNGAQKSINAFTLILQVRFTRMGKFGSNGSGLAQRDGWIEGV